MDSVSLHFHNLVTDAFLLSQTLRILSLISTACPTSVCKQNTSSFVFPIFFLLTKFCIAIDSFIYPIICLKSVCLATFAECSSQFLIVRLERCLKLIASTRGTFCHEFESQFGLELFYTGNTANHGRPARRSRSPLCGR